MLGKNLITAAAGAGAAGAVLGIEDVFSTWLYTGNGSTQTITNGIDLSGEGGLVWVQERSANGFGNQWFDTERGPTKYIRSYSTAAETTNANTLTSFNSTGFSLGVASNYSGYSFASWTFRKAEKFFDVVTYTGNGSARTVAHNLGSVPGCIIVKRTDTAGNWIVYHRSLGATKNLLLESTAAENTSSVNWNDTAPTSSVFTVGTGTLVNASGGTYVAYLFAHDAGGFGDDGTESVIKCGSFSGSATVDLGWEPQWLLVKGTGTSQWHIWDTMRGLPVSGSGLRTLTAESSAAETGNSDFYLTSTGFVNNNYGGFPGQTCIYIAIRRGPMKTPEDATTAFVPLAFTGSTGTSRNSNFPIDLNLQKARNYAYNSFSFSDRLRGFQETSGTGTLQLYSASAAAETTSNGAAVYQCWNETRRDGAYNVYATSIEYNFRRAPGFFDVVAYTGTGSARTVSHNLGVAPEMMIVKKRNGNRNWAVYHSSLGANLYLNLNNNVAAQDGTFHWGVAPTSTEFTVGLSAETNESSGTYIAYLFATCPGVSKVGSFTGDGNASQNIECGFTSGARFVLVKGTTGTTDWLVWDTARGIVSGNDPLLKLNSTAAEETNTDDIDPYSGGFAVTNVGSYGLNVSGRNYIFLAIA